MQTSSRFNRFKTAPWFSEEPEHVLVGGAGGIGSWLSLLLTRAGFVPIVYDFDNYESHNMGGQLCKFTDVGQPKVDSLMSTIKEFCDQQEIMTFNEKYEEGTMTSNYVFAGFDNMEARKNMFLNWKNTYGQDANAIYIDGRLTAEQLQIFCVIGNTPAVQHYEQHLFHDDEVEDLACTFKQTSHAAAMIAAHMVGFFTNFIANVKTGVPARSIPFFWEYLIPLDLLNIE